MCWCLGVNPETHSTAVWKLCVCVCARVNFHHLSPDVCLSNPPCYFAIHSIIQNRIPTDQYFVYIERCIIKLSNSFLMLWQYFWHFSEVSGLFHTDKTLWVNQADTWHCQLSQQCLCATPIHQKDENLFGSVPHKAAVMQVVKILVCAWSFEGFLPPKSAFRLTQTNAFFKFTLEMSVWWVWGTATIP